MAPDRRWSAARVTLQAQALSIVLILAAMLRAQDEMAWSRWERWLFVGRLLLVLTLIGWAGLRSRKSHSAPLPNVTM